MVPKQDKRNNYNMKRIEESPLLDKQNKGLYYKIP